MRTTLLAVCLTALLGPIAALAEKGPGEVVFKGGNGTTMAKAVVVTGAFTAAEGARAEYAWLAKHREGWQPQFQQVIVQDGKLYNAIRIAFEDKEAVIYFDITAYLAL